MTHNNLTEGGTYLFSKPFEPVNMKEHRDCVPYKLSCLKVVRITEKAINVEDGNNRGYGAFIGNPESFWMGLDYFNSYYTLVEDITPPKLPNAPFKP
tara:strand:- start:163 stop:453 length:291 start_codon:yes stop_codon:yes gene_type:complete